VDSLNMRGCVFLVNVIYIYMGYTSEEVDTK